MKITKEYVGLEVQCPRVYRNMCIEVKYVGEDHFFGKVKNKGEGCFFNNLDWELYEEPKKKRKKKRKILSPVVSKVVSSFYISDTLYETEEMARQARGEYFHSWPAMQLIDGKEVPIQVIVEE